MGYRDRVRFEGKKEKLTTEELFSLTTAVVGHMTDMDQLQYIVRFTKKRIFFLAGKPKKPYNEGPSKQTGKPKLKRGLSREKKKKWAKGD